MDNNKLYANHKSIRDIRAMFPNIKSFKTQEQDEELNRHKS
jgi:hypothetical protein